VSTTQNISALRRRDVTMLVMSDAYHELLDAAIQHLQELKMQGVRFVQVSPESVAVLNEKVRSVPPKRTFAPAPAVQPEQRAMPILRPAPKAVQVTPIEVKPAPVSLAVDVTGATQAISVPALGSEGKIAAFAELRERAMACVKCPH